MKNKFYYPAVFHKEDIGYSVWMHDISGCISQGDGTVNIACKTIYTAYIGS